MITSKNGFSKTINEPDAQVTFSKAAVYKATLTVTDDNGAVSTQSLQLTAGNDPPVLSFDMGKSNKSFYFPGKTYNYKVAVKDKEDGSLANGRIKPSQVVVNIDYHAEGFDKAEIAQGHRTAEASTRTAKGLRLIQASDCKACHNPTKKSIGPTYMAISTKYKTRKGAVDLLSKKIITGGSGVWGNVPMAAHPKISSADAAEMVKYILAVSEPKPKVKSLPVEGAYTIKLPTGDKGQGVYIFRASYSDRGANGLPSIPSEETFVLRNPKINPAKYDVFDNVNKMSFNNNDFVIPSKSGSYIGLKQIDLTGITQIDLNAMAPKEQLNAEGGMIELRMDAPNGKLLGQTEFIGDKPGSTLTFSAKPVFLKVTPTEGVHDIYLVFQNPNAKPGALMIVFNTDFKTDASVVDSTTQKAVTPVDLNVYAGKYKMTGLPFPFIEVSVTDGKVFMKAGEQGGEIKPMGEEDKFDADGKATILFIRDEKKKVIKLKMEAMGFSFDGMKE